MYVKLKSMNQLEVKFRILMMVVSTCHSIWWICPLLCTWVQLIDTKPNPHPSSTQKPQGSYPWSIITQKLFYFFLSLHYVYIQRSNFIQNTSVAFGLIFCGTNSPNNRLTFRSLKNSTTRFTLEYIVWRTMLEDVFSICGYFTYSCQTLFLCSSKIFRFLCWNLVVPLLWWLSSRCRRYFSKYFSNYTCECDFVLWNK